MRGLTVIVTDEAPARLRAALLLTLAQVALGARGRIFVDGPAVSVLRSPIVTPDDAAHARAGLPTTGALVEEALDGGVELLLCQTGLAAIEGGVGAFDPRLGVGGLVGVMATLGDDRLVAL